MRSSRSVVDVLDYRCTVCDMTLWNPVARLGSSFVGLYDDARFPGRCILLLDTHVEQLDELQPQTVLAVQQDLVELTAALRTVTSAKRINYAILGNAEPHLHWHVIPRQPALEAKPNSSPWDDPRPHAKLDATMKDELITALRAQLTGSASRKRDPSTLASERFFRRLA